MSFPVVSVEPTERPMSVLLVDDEPALLRALARWLRCSSLDVSCASSADEALGVLARRSIDVLVSDIDMPGKSGFELLSIVRREHPSTVRMLLTGGATTDRALAAINEGEVARFFAKPLEPNVLRDSILAMSDRVRRMRQDESERMRHARIEALRSWAERTFPGTCEIDRDDRGALVVRDGAASLLL
jgi:DNA-binding NtrC family response regulator